VTKDEKLARKFDQSEYKELFAKAIIKLGYTNTFAHRKATEQFMSI